MKSSYPKIVESFLFDLSLEVSRQGGHLLLTDREYVRHPKSGIMMNGYYSSGRPRKLVVATKKKFTSWLPVLVHESCHLDQDLEGSTVWRDLIVAPWQKDAHELIFEAIQKPEEFDDGDLSDFIRRVQAVERDCEERAVAKIDLWNLPIDEEEYIRRANSYLWYFAMLPELRMWYPTGREPYNNPDVWKNCPNHFAGDYSVVPRPLEEAYIQYCS